MANHPELLKTVDCSTCGALCCRAGMVMPLSPAEAEFMSSDNKLTVVQPPRPRKFLGIVSINGYGFKPGVYIREEDCSHLTLGAEGSSAACDIHDDPEFPTACEGFEVGGHNCRTLRFIGGIDTESELLAYLEVTGVDSGGSSVIPEHVLALAAANVASRN